MGRLQRLNSLLGFNRRSTRNVGYRWPLTTNAPYPNDAGEAAFMPVGVSSTSDPDGEPCKGRPQRVEVRREAQEVNSHGNETPAYRLSWATSSHALIVDFDPNELTHWRVAETVPPTSSLGSSTAESVPSSSRVNLMQIPGAFETWSSSASIADTSNEQYEGTSTTSTSPPDSARSFDGRSHGPCFPLQRKGKLRVADCSRPLFHRDGGRSRDIAVLASARDHYDRLLQIASDEESAKHLQQQLDEEARYSRLKECRVCGDAREQIHFSTRAPTPLCEHESITCRGCMKSWIASEFERKGCEGIKCPDCPQILDYFNVKRLASKATFAAYDNICTRSAMSNMPGFSWCTAPGCGSGQINDGEYMDCVLCRFKQCTKHNVAWHTGETCAQYDYRTSGAKARDEERKTQATLDRVTKTCPGPRCIARIEKNLGCAHMTCWNCKYEFCWQCLASHQKILRQGNTAHEEDCPYHSKNVEITWPFNAH